MVFVACSFVINSYLPQWYFYTGLDQRISQFKSSFSLDDMGRLRRDAMQFSPLFTGGPLKLQPCVQALGH
jgi:hypothetical protein